MAWPVNTCYLPFSCLHDKFLMQSLSVSVRRQCSISGLLHRLSCLVSLWFFSVLQDTAPIESILMWPQSSLISFVPISSITTAVDACHSHALRIFSHLLRYYRVNHCSWHKDLRHQPINKHIGSIFSKLDAFTALWFTRPGTPLDAKRGAVNSSLTHGAEPFLRSCQLYSHSRNSQHFMEPEGSITCSKESSTDPYPEQDQSNPYHTILYLEDPF
jgi:hypothetical protein